MVNEIYKQLLDTLGSFPPDSPIIEQTDRFLVVLISLDDEEQAEQLVKIAENVASGSHVIVRGGGSAH